MYILIVLIFNSLYIQLFIIYVQLLGNFLQWHGILSNKTLQELSIDGLLNRYILMAFQNSEYGDDSIKKAQSVSKSVTFNHSFLLLSILFKWPDLHVHMKSWFKVNWLNMKDQHPSTHCSKVHAVLLQLCHKQKKPGSVLSCHLKPDSSFVFLHIKHKHYPWFVLGWPPVVCFSQLPES